MGIVKLKSFIDQDDSLYKFCSQMCDETSLDSLNRMVFLIKLDEIGECREANDFLRREMALYLSGKTTVFHSLIAGLIVISDSEYYTKNYAKKFIFLANQMGCEFVGHCMVERISGHRNFNTWAKAMHMPLESLEQMQIQKLFQRIQTFDYLNKSVLKGLVLHAGHKSLSNTYTFWDDIKSQLNDKRFEFHELHVEEGKIVDCHGCGFETCLYYSKQDSCFYGGFVVDDLYPAIEAADFIVWICPNYNDAISAKLMAVINRLTALYRKMPFYDKYIFSVVVSGNSGSDVVAEQLIDALNINKGFRVPPRFVATAIANDPGEIRNSYDYDKRITNYVNDMFEFANKNIKKY